MARLQQLILALVFLTRLPLGRFLPPKVLPLAGAAWAFPVAGAVVGAIAGIPLWLGHGLLPAALAVTLAVWLTGALHEDALADFADAGGGRDRADRLRIMRDSTIGSYGTAALVCATLIRVAALSALGPMALIAAATAGRLAPVLLMQTMPPARSDGLGQGAGRPGRAACAVAAGLAALVIALATGITGVLAAILIVPLATWMVAKRALRLVGGQTGDVLGAAVLVTEIAVLATLALTA
ncbi:adenosylcobinamide-GDP ribazoletransferase [Paracoccus sediminilitoris]|uniref:adenosylcobinamide-GDP ribazoletransferase n=1 Tax=Paracoccus sediminilitoris TaxID=2202419 RepID=UPI00272AB451|nr:adenosylcobinamide-GDP ribazoletransferase [Paracoccus sediminilitoris]